MTLGRKFQVPMFNVIFVIAPVRICHMCRVFLCIPVIFFVAFILYFSFCWSAMRKCGLVLNACFWTQYSYVASRSPMESAHVRLSALHVSPSVSRPRRSRTIGECQGSEAKGGTTLLRNGRSERYEYHPCFVPLWSTALPRNHTCVNLFITSQALFLFL